ncbi:MAG: hypothetical protein AB7H70_02280 [Rhodospirillaceae bacterium]
MAPSPPIFLATSLVPGRDAALQSAAVNSWRAAGFHVLSVNGKAEADAIRAGYPGIDVAAPAGTAERFAKKPVPYIHDMLKALHAAIAASGHDPAICVAGLINADIYLRDVAGLKSFIQREAQGALLCGPRVDVPGADHFAGYAPTGREVYSIGYDYFFLPGKFLDDYAESPFCMGMPFWDYWFPLVTLLRGKPIKTLNSPVALHVSHETRWDDTVYLFFHALITYVMELGRQTRGQNPKAEGRQFDLLFDFVQHFYGAVFKRGTEAGANGTVDAAGVAMLADFYDRFQQVAVHHIKTQAAPVTLAEALA